MALDGEVTRYYHNIAFNVEGAVLANGRFLPSLSIVQIYVHCVVLVATTSHPNRKTRICVATCISASHDGLCACLSFNTCSVSY